MIYNSPFKVEKANEVFEKLSKTEGVIVFGTGNCGLLVLAALKKANVKIICLADNNKSRWGTVYNDHKVVSPEELKSTNNQTPILINGVKIDGLYSPVELTGSPVKWPLFNEGFW